MKPIARRDLALVALLILVGASLRVALRDIPNFAPVAALALFAGYVLRNRMLSMIVPIGVMVVSDSIIGRYDWYMMGIVYGMLALPALVGHGIQHRFGMSGGNSRRGRAFAGLLTCSLAMSVLFFLVTNFASWQWFHSYSRDLPGLLSCYAAGIPFFRYTLAGDLFFGVMTFGSYAVITAWQTGWQQKVATE